MEEGEWARFCCRVTGHPRPRVMWLVNGHTVVNGSRYRLTYDGMYHMDIPKTRQYDTGKVEVIARSSVGEAIADTQLNVIPRHDDYRKVLKNSPRRKYYSFQSLPQHYYSEYFSQALNTNNIGSPLNSRVEKSLSIFSADTLHNALQQLDMLTNITLHTLPLIQSFSRSLGAFYHG